jgi:hypothetical protein
MAYVSQEKKKEIHAALKAVFPKSWKWSLAVNHGSSLVLNIWSAPVDLLAMVNAKIVESAERRNEQHLVSTWNSYAQLNPYYLERQFEGEALKIMEKAKAQMFGHGYFDKSEPMTDYFHCAWYVNMNLGKYDKPFKVVA